MKFRPFWLEQLEATTLTLLDHFIEDADNYAQVTLDRPSLLHRQPVVRFSNSTSNATNRRTKISPSRIKSPHSTGISLRPLPRSTRTNSFRCRAFATVLRALSNDFAATPNLLPYEYVDSWLQKILHTSAMIRGDPSFGLVAKSGNVALSVLLETFTKIDEPFQEAVFNYLIEQTKLNEQKWPYEADANLLRLIGKVLDMINHESCAQLVGAIFAPPSRLWSYRFLHSNSVIK